MTLTEWLQAHPEIDLVSNGFEAARALYWLMISKQFIASIPGPAGKIYEDLQGGDQHNSECIAIAAHRQMQAAGMPSEIVLSNDVAKALIDSGRFDLLTKVGPAGWLMHDPKQYPEVRFAVDKPWFTCETCRRSWSPETLQDLGRCVDQKCGGKAIRTGPSEHLLPHPLDGHGPVLNPGLKPFEWTPYETQLRTIQQETTAALQAAAAAGKLTSTIFITSAAPPDVVIRKLAEDLARIGVRVAPNITVDGQNQIPT